MALTLLILGEYMTGISIAGIYPAIITSIILALIGFFVRPILLILALPINLITLGLFTLVINAGLFWFTASIIEGFTVDSFWYAFLGSLVWFVVTYLSKKIIK